MQRIARRLSFAVACPPPRLGGAATPLLSLVLACSVPAATAAAQWSQPSPGTPPSARTDAAIGYDVGRRTSVLFGGFPGNAETHVWDGTTWNQRAIVGPPASWGGAMAYEAQANGLLLFGGNTPTGPTAGTWRFTGTQWVRVFPTVSPTARWFHAMAYDPLRQRIVLYGGQSAPSSYLGDTWEWDGNLWVQRAATGPVPRAGHKMAWDPRRSRVLLFGGGASSGARGDTWEWDGTTWTQILVGGPAPDDRPHLATVGANIALFQSSAVQRTWTWNGTAWSQFTSPAEPAQRSGAAMATDVSGAVLFGGYNVIFGYHQDTWTLRVPTTRLTVPASAAATEGNSLLPLGSATRRRMQTVIDAAAFPPDHRAGILHGVHLRRDGSQLLFPGRNLDLRVALGVAATLPMQMSTNFLANYAGTPTIVYQGTVSLPPALPPQPAPAPFQLALPFGTVFLWNGQNLALELDLLGTNLPAAYDLDAVGQPHSAGIVSGAGQSCAGSVGPPAMRLPSAAGLVIGGAIDIGLHAARPGAIAFNFLGDNDTQWLGIPLPFAWPGTSCNVYHNWVVNQPALVAGDGTAQVLYPIPHATHLSGTRLFSQWGVYEGVGRAPLVTTGMARMTIGPVPAVHWDTITNTDGSAQGSKTTGAWTTPVLQFDLN